MRTISPLTIRSSGEPWFLDLQVRSRSPEELLIEAGHIAGATSRATLENRLGESQRPGGGGHDQSLAVCRSNCLSDCRRAKRCPAAHAAQVA